MKRICVNIIKVRMVNLGRPSIEWHVPIYCKHQFLYDMYMTQLYDDKTVTMVYPDQIFCKFGILLCKRFFK